MMLLLFGGPCEKQGRDWRLSAEIPQPPIHSSIHPSFLSPDPTDFTDPSTHPSIGQQLAERMSGLMMFRQPSALLRFRPLQPPPSQASFSTLPTMTAARRTFSGSQSAGFFFRQSVISSRPSLQPQPRPPKNPVLTLSFPFSFLFPTLSTVLSIFRRCAGSHPSVRKISRIESMG